MSPISLFWCAAWLSAAQQSLAPVPLVRADQETRLAQGTEGSAAPAEPPSAVGSPDQAPPAEAVPLPDSAYDAEQRILGLIREGRYDGLVGVADDGRGYRYVDHRGGEAVWDVTRDMPLPAAASIPLGALREALETSDAFIDERGGADHWLVNIMGPTELSWELELGRMGTGWALLAVHVRDE